MDALQNNLLNKWLHNALPHFLIIRGEGPEVFAKDFIINIWQKELHCDQKRALHLFEQGHADLLWLSPEENTYYWSKTQNDFKELLRFLESRSLELSQKIVVIDKAHVLSEAILNKLLKDLEDSSNVIFFFLVPSKRPLIQTIESRAITINIPQTRPKEQTALYNHINVAVEAHTEDDEFRKLLMNFITHKKGEHELLEAIKKADDEELLKALLDIEKDHEMDYVHKYNFLNDLKHFQKSKIFNNSSKERFYQILCSLRS